MSTALQVVDDVKTLPRELVDFARRQVVNAMLYKGDERRREGRYPMMLPVRAVWVDDNDEAVGESFELITRDVSSTGIALLHTQPLDGERLAIQFSIADTLVNMVIEMIWDREMGTFHGAAGRFVVKLDQFPG